MREHDDPRLREILDRAAELPPDQRSSFFDGACAGNAELRAEVESLLSSSEGAGGLLGEPTIGPSRVRTVQPPSHKPSITRLGDFQILRELGRGGMGVVYEARQVSLNRKVALKVLANSLGLTPKAVIRFKREAEAAARLHHTNIVPIYATGEHEGCHYYAMEQIEGPSLDEVIRQMRQLRDAPPAVAERPAAGQATTVASADPNDWATTVMGYDAPGALHSSATTTTLSSTGSQGGGYFDTVARLFAEVADALDYAHAQGVIHRDMKPSNLLLSPQGRLSINDFGLARMLEQPGMTVSGEFIGSPMYMSPEQITAGRTPLDHRTDIYSLGAALYEVLTLRTPFEGERRDQILAQILHKEPRRPRSIDRKVPQDLETICLKAIEKDPDRRYQTAGQMAEDLRRYLSRFAISARRVGPIGRSIRWARRSRAMAAALGGLLVAIVLGSFFAARAYTEHRERLKEEQEQSLDQATAAALSGDEQQATQFIFDAEQKGAAQGRIRLLYGLLAWRKEDYAAAEKELQQARKLMPDSVAPIALLSLVYAASDQWEKLNEILVLLERLQPQTEEEFLFKGMAESNIDPDGAIPYLNTAARMRNSGVVREAREGILVSRAMDTRSLEDVESALADATFAEAALPGDPNTLTTGLNTRLCAAVVYEKTGHSDKQKLMMAAAGKLAEELGSSRYRDSFQCHWSRLFFFDLCGDGTAERRELEELIRLKSFDAWVWEAQLLIREGDLANAIVLANDARTRPIILQAQVSAAVILAESDPNSARALIQSAAARLSGGTIDLFPPIMLRLLGEKAEAEKDLRALRQRKPHWPWRGGWYEKLLAFHCGETTAQQLLAQAGTSEFSQCEANCHIAIEYLAEGDRAQARKHFQASVDTGVFPFIEFEWSRTFLARMDQDPNWPSWIPNSATQPSAH